MSGSVPVGGRKLGIYFFQFNFKYEKEVFLPYSVSILWAYARTFKEINDNYENKGVIFLRADPEKIVASLEGPDAAVFSTYVWNWQLSTAVAKKIREKFPRCLIVFGGPQIPNRMHGFFDQYPFIDITAHSEGELTFAEILKERLKPRTNYAELKGLTFNSRDGNIKPWMKRERIADLDSIPSPYLSGLFDEIIRLPYHFQPLWETNRGCPYSCAYCDWGSSTMTRIRLFNEERLYKEIEWFSDNKMSFIFGCDANFGMLARDVELAKRLAKKKAETGFPGKFRVSYAKNSTERVLQIARILNEQHLDKGITLSMQSMDETTLQIVKRTNLRIDSLAKFIKEYQKDGIATYTELILGLPGETYASFKEGIDKLLNAGVHDSFTIYNCTVLPNAPLNEPEYRRRWEIKTIRTPIFLNHSVPGDDPVQEYEEMIVSTKTLPVEDWKKQYLFSWLVQACHSLNLTQVIAIYFKAGKGLKYSDFYEGLLSFARAHPGTMIGQELAFTEKKVDTVLQDGSWDIVLDEFSNITWATEEATYLRVSENLDRFYEETKQFVRELCQKFGLELEAQLFEDLISTQKALVVKWKQSGSQAVELSDPVYGFYKANLVGAPFNLRKGRFELKVKDDLNFNGDKKRYAREIVWWGRKGGKFSYQNVQETTL